ncbi:MAG: ABC transporter substrate-binding protein [Myxococcales bacterium]|nr:ABC transporter substrate-binding protein [Myxococcales bacterium]
MALASTAAFADRPKVLVLKSSDLAAYASVVAGFAAEVRAEVQEITLEEGADSAKAFRRISEQPPAMILAIGPAAANGAKRALSEVPVVFSMVPYYEKYGLEGPNVTGIALTSDLSAELATLKAVAPSARRVGILEDPRYSAKVIEEASTIAQQQGMQLVPIEVDAPSKVERALKAAKGKIDAMLLIADKTVASAQVVKRLIEFCQQERLPLAALSSSQVKEGALLSLSPSYTGIGQQAGRLANRILHEKVDPGALAVAEPETLDLAMNLSTAKRLGGQCELALELFKLAAQKGYPVKVFE